VADPAFDLVDFIFGEIASAIQDSRSKLVDEAWFGQPTPTRDELNAWSVGERSAAFDDIEGRATAEQSVRPVSFDEFWAARDDASAPDLDQPQELDFDR